MHDWCKTVKINKPVDWCKCVNIKQTDWIGANMLRLDELALKVQICVDLENWHDWRKYMKCKQTDSTRGNMQTERIGENMWI